jgi:hypothetical protein
MNGLKRAETAMLEPDPVNFLSSLTGLEAFVNINPPINRWAILGRPCGLTDANAANALANSTETERNL